MTDILATLEEHRFWVVIGFGVIMLIILAVYVRNMLGNKAEEKKAKARRAKRKAAAAGAAGAAVNYDANGMPLDDDDDGEFRDAEHDDMEGDGESVYKDWD